MKHVRRWFTGRRRMIKVQLPAAASLAAVPTPPKADSRAVHTVQRLAERQPGLNRHVAPLVLANCQPYDPAGVPIPLALSIAPQRLNQHLYVPDTNAWAGDTWNKNSSCSLRVLQNFHDPHTSLIVLDARHEIYRALADTWRATHEIVVLTSEHVNWSGRRVSYHPFAYLPDHDGPELLELAHEMSEALLAIYGTNLKPQYPLHRALRQQLHVATEALIIHLRVVEPAAPFQRLSELGGSDRLLHVLRASPAPRVRELAERLDPDLLAETTRLLRSFTGRQFGEQAIEQGEHFVPTFLTQRPTILFIMGSQGMRDIRMSADSLLILFTWQVCRLLTQEALRWKVVPTGTAPNAVRFICDYAPILGQIPRLAHFIESWRQEGVDLSFILGASSPQEFMDTFKAEGVGKRIFDLIGTHVVWPATTENNTMYGVDLFSYAGGYIKTPDLPPVSFSWRNDD